jgi:hypothetical protein
LLHPLATDPSVGTLYRERRVGRRRRRHYMAAVTARIVGEPELAVAQARKKGPQGRAPVKVRKVAP